MKEESSLARGMEIEHFACATQHVERVDVLSAVTHELSCKQYQVVKYLKLFHDLVKIFFVKLGVAVFFRKYMSTICECAFHAKECVVFTLACLKNTASRCFFVFLEISRFLSSLFTLQFRPSLFFLPLNDEIHWL